MIHSVEEIGRTHGELSDRRRDSKRFSAQDFVAFAQANAQKYNLIEENGRLLVDTWHCNDLIDGYRATLVDAVPKEVTLCADTGMHTASFGYYEGKRFSEAKGLKFGTDFADVRNGTHYLVSCGDVVLRVRPEDFPEVERRTI